MIVRMRLWRKSIRLACRTDALCINNLVDRLESQSTTQSTKQALKMADATFDDFPQGAAPAGQKPTTPTAWNPFDDGHDTGLYPRDYLRKALGWMGATITLASVVGKPNS
jgi:hypothetical protein